MRINLRPPAIRSLPEELPAPTEFRNPPPGHGPVPFWLWNARLEEAEVRRQVRELAEKGCSGAVILPHRGLPIPFLSAEWLEQVRAALDEAAACGLRVWLGAPDTEVTAQHLELRAQHLHLQEVPADREPVQVHPEGQLLGAWAVPRSADAAVSPAPLYPDARGQIRFDPAGERWRVLLFTARPGTALDATHPEAAARLLQLTAERYADALGDHFGTVIAGLFLLDTPAISHPLPWSLHLREAFRQRHGDDLCACLPALALPLPNAAQVRCDYHAALTALYTNNFLAPIRQWCAGHDLEFAGVVPAGIPPLDGSEALPALSDLPALCRTFDIAGVGGEAARLDRQPQRLAASAAHQEGRTGVLAPLVASGWGATLAERKACVDALLARGINRFLPFGLYYTVCGERKREPTPSEFEQEAFWPHYQHFATYLARLCDLLARGRHGARIALFYPLRSLWAHHDLGSCPPDAQVAFAGAGSPDPLLRARVEHDLAALCDLLTTLHFDFDFIDEEGLARARIEKSRLCLGHERYELLILPSVTTCTRATWARVAAFFAAGGNVLSCGLLPFQSGEGPAADAELRAAVQELTTLDPTAPDRPSGTTARAMGRDAMRPLNVNRAHGSRVARYLPSHVPLPAQRALLMNTLMRTLVTLDADLDCPDLVCHQRVTADGKLFFLANTTDEPRKVRAIFYALGHPEEWDPETGAVRRLWHYARAGEKVTMPLHFAPRQTRVVTFTGTDTLRVERASFVVTNVTEGEDHTLVQGHARDYDQPLDTPPNCSLAWEGGGRWAEGIDKGLLEPLSFGEVWDLRVLGDNTLVLPEWRCHQPRPGQDPTTLGSFQEHWETLTARRSDWCSSPPAEAWFQTRFHLDSVPRNLSLLLEPLDVPYTVLVNGQEVTPLQTGVLDPRFLTADIAEVVVEGQNVVALRVAYADAPANADRIPEPARLLGDFTALPEEEGEFLLYAGVPERIRTGSWTDQGFPHFTGVLEYTQPLFVAPDYFEFRLMLVCEQPAAIVEVLVNGKPAGVRCWPPYAVDVSELLFAGENQVTLRVTNTAVNALLGRPRPSGLLGPVRIEPYARIEVKVPRQ